MVFPWWWSACLSAAGASMGRIRSNDLDDCYCCWTCFYKWMYILKLAYTLILLQSLKKRATIVPVIFQKYFIEWRAVKWWWLMWIVKNVMAGLKLLLVKLAPTYEAQSQSYSLIRGVLMFLEGYRVISKIILHLLNSAPHWPFYSCAWICVSGWSILTETGTKVVHNARSEDYSCATQYLSNRKQNYYD